MANLEIVNFHPLRRFLKLLKLANELNLSSVDIITSLQ